MKTLAIFLAACAVAGSAEAQTADRGRLTDEVRVVVRYGDIDPSHAPGARTLVNRIRGAARTACGPRPSIVDLAQSADFNACVRRSGERAVRFVNEPLVTAIFDGREDRIQLAGR